eukprot:SAG11_NODE_17863_length_507_cov_0.696078_1_plen_120_part_01
MDPKEAHPGGPATLLLLKAQRCGRQITVPVSTAGNMRYHMISVVALLAAADAGVHSESADGDAAAEYVVHVRQQPTHPPAAADGSASAPFASIHAARDHIRALRGGLRANEAGGASYRVV